MYYVDRSDRCYRILYHDGTPMQRVIRRQWNGRTHNSNEQKADAEGVFWAHPPDDTSCMLDIGDCAYMDKQWVWTGQQAPWVQAR